MKKPRPGGGEIRPGLLVTNVTLCNALSGAGAPQSPGPMILPYARLILPMA